MGSSWMFVPVRRRRLGREAAGGAGSSGADLLPAEKGERAQTAPLDKVFVLAAALGVPPIHLLIPLEDEAAVQIAPGKPYKSIPAPLARAWIRGEIVLPASDMNWSELPESELRRLVEQALTRGMSPVARALMQDELRETVRRITDEIRHPEREEEQHG